MADIVHLAADGGTILALQGTGSDPADDAHNMRNGSTLLYYKNGSGLRVKRFGKAAESVLDSEETTDADSVLRANALATAGTKNFSSKVLGDAADRFSINADGEMSFGGGSAAADLGLLREAASILAVRKGTAKQILRVYDTYSSDTNFHRAALKTARATLSGVSGASVTATGLIPKGAVVVGVTTKVTTGLGTGNGTTGYKVGDGSDPDRWGDIAGTAAGTASDNRDWTAGGIQAFTADSDVVITATDGDFDGTGVIYVSVQYLAGEVD